MFNKKLLFLLVVFLPISAFAAKASKTDIIWVWGNGDLIASMVTFIYNVIKDQSMINILVKIAALIGIVVLFVKEFARSAGDVKGGTFVIKTIMFVIFSFILYTFFLTVKKNSEYQVYILNSNENISAKYSTCNIGAPNSECYAPLGVKYTMSFLTNIQKSILDLMDKAMMDTTVLAYSYNKSGLGFPLTFQKQASELMVDDVYKYQTFMEYYNKCLLFDLADGTKKLDDIKKSGNLENSLKSTSSRLTVVYSAAKPEGETKQCYQVSTKDYFGTITCSATAKKLVSSGGTNYAKNMGVNFKANYCDSIDNYAQKAFKERAGADYAIKQATAVKMLKMANKNLSFAEGTAIGERELRFKWNAIGEMAKDWLPSIMGIFQAFVLGMIWFLPLISIATFSFRSVGYVIAFEMVLVIWAILLNLINFATISQLIDNFNFVMVDGLGNRGSDNTSLYTLYTADAMNEKNANALAFLGYMSVLSFGVAMGVVGKSAGAFNGFVSGLAQMAPGIHTISSAAKGGTSYGLTSNTEQGVATKNRNGYEKHMPDGSISNTNMDGKRDQTYLDAKNNITEVNEAGNQKTMTKTNTNDTSVSQDMNNDSIVKYKSSTGFDAKASEIYNNTTQGQIDKAASEKESIGKQLTNSQSSQTAHAKSGIDAVASKTGTNGDLMWNDTKKEAFSNAYKSAILKSHVEQSKVDDVESMSADVYADMHAGGSVPLLGGASVGLKTNFKTALGWTDSQIDNFQKNLNHEYAKELSSISTKQVNQTFGVGSERAKSFSNETRELSGASEQLDRSYTSATELLQTYKRSISASQAERNEMSNNAVIKYLEQRTEGFTGEGKLNKAMDIATNLDNNTNGERERFSNWLQQDMSNKTVSSNDVNNVVGGKIANTGSKIKNGASTLKQPTGNQTPKYNLDEKENSNDQKVTRMTKDMKGTLRQAKRSEK